MAGFLLAMLAMIATGLGARDQMLVARMAPNRAILLVALASSALTVWAAFWAGRNVAPHMIGQARLLLVVIALVIAGLELLLLRPGRKPLEPTQSLGAFAIVILAQQLTDASRLALFALAAASSLPPATLLGGLIGGSASVAAGWFGGEAWERQPLLPVRRCLGVLVLLMAAWLASLQGLA